MPKLSIANTAMRLILALTGVAIGLLGVNVGFGGIATLGWQGQADFLQITDMAAFAVQDSHIRFLGGFWLAAGLVFCVGAIDPHRMRTPIVALCLMVSIGGLARLSAGDFSLLSSGAILPSLLFELIAFPVLGLWLARYPA